MQRIKDQGEEKIIFIHNENRPRGKVNPILVSEEAFRKGMHSLLKAIEKFIALLSLKVNQIVPEL